MIQTSIRMIRVICRAVSLKNWQAKLLCWWQNRNSWTWRLSFSLATDGQDSRTVLGVKRLRTNTRLLFTTFVYPKKSSGTGFSVVGFLPTKWYEQTNRFCGGNFLFKAASHCLLKSGSSGIRCNLYGGAHEQSFFSKDLWSKQGKFSKLFSFLWFQLQPLTAQFAPLPCLFCRSVAIITCSSEYTDQKLAA